MAVTPAEQPAPTGSATAADVVRDPRRWFILAICCSSLFVVVLDSTAVNVALPNMRADLGASTAGLQWAVSAYTLVLASLLMLSGSTGDRIGRVRMFQIGLAVFSTGSLLCSLAPNIELLIVFRMLQGVGGSMLNPVAMSIIRNTFDDPRERAQAIGVWGAMIGLSMAFGPVVGGGLVELESWRAIFWINVPVGVAAMVLTHRFVPESRAPTARRIDPVGQVLVIVFLATVVFAIIQAPDAGWASLQTLGLLAVSAVSLVLLVVYESRCHEPLIDPRFFRSAPFAGASLIAVLAFVSLGGFLFLNTLYLQEARGLSPLHAGLYTLPMAVTTVVVAPVTGRIVGRFGTRWSLAAGGAAIVVSAIMLTGLGRDTSVAWLFASYVLFGVGFGSVNPPITNTAVSGMPAEQAGVASAVASTSRQVGSSLGVAIVGAVAVGTATSGAAVAESSHPGWWIVAGCAVAIVVLAFASTGAWARGTAERAAAALRTRPS
ncbi:MFS transporter [Patulibacter minatonensis]|uniref:MFS transporter n=1 Tax=Patulibacter minatonensis TaxID=298163 RepID=UPI000A045975|nr:MFS transporter [Patulibacter minatonensis]